jgi:lipoprotein-anchoring transpeptidase ErfK/SrfK
MATLAVRSLAILVAACAAAGLTALAAERMSRPALPPVPQPASPRAAEPGVVEDRVRVRYQGAEQPRLALPGGQQKTVSSVLKIDYPMRFGSYVWDDAGVPQGPVWVRVDVANQLISVFRGGHEIGSAVILYGAESKPTPAGAFTVLQKAKDYHSRTYDAPMPFMLRLTDDGVAIHASNVREGWATHGCIGVPDEFARRLFAEMQLGDAVFVVT